MDTLKSIKQTGFALSFRDTICEALGRHKGARDWTDVSLETGEYIDGGISDQTLRRIWLAYAKPNDKNAIQSLSWKQLEALAKMLSIDPRPYRPADDRLCYCDPTLNPHQMSDLIATRRKHESKASELNGYAAFLPCSLETPAFMHAHHDALYKHVFGTTTQDRRLLITAYNDFGAASLARIKSPDRRFIFRHHMYTSDLRAISEGRGAYRHIAADVRGRCLKNLIRLLKDANNKIEMRIAGRKIPELKGYLEEADSWFVTGETLAAWRSKRGSIYWTEDKKDVARVGEMLALFGERSSLKTNSEVIDFLKGLIA